MSSISIGCIGILLLLAAIFLRMPIGMAMLAVGTAGFAAISGTDAALGLLRGVPYEPLPTPPMPWSASFCSWAISPSNPASATNFSPA